MIFSRCNPLGPQTRSYAVRIEQATASQVDDVVEVLLRNVMNCTGKARGRRNGRRHGASGKGKLGAPTALTTCPTDCMPPTHGHVLSEQREALGGGGRQGRTAGELTGHRRAAGTCPPPGWRIKPSLSCPAPAPCGAFPNLQRRLLLLLFLPARLHRLKRDGLCTGRHTAAARPQSSATAVGARRRRRRRAAGGRQVRPTRPRRRCLASGLQ